MPYYIYLNLLFILFYLHNIHSPINSILIILFSDRTRSFTSDTNREGLLRDTREKKHILVNKNLENILKKSIARHEGTAFARITRPSVTDQRDGSGHSSSSRIAVVIRPNERQLPLLWMLLLANFFPRDLIRFLSVLYSERNFLSFHFAKYMIISLEYKY